MSFTAAWGITRWTELLSVWCLRCGWQLDKQISVFCGRTQHSVCACVCGSFTLVWGDHALDWIIVQMCHSSWPGRSRAGLNYCTNVSFTVAWGITRWTELWSSLLFSSLRGWIGTTCDLRPTNIFFVSTSFISLFHYVYDLFIATPAFIKEFYFLSEV